MLFPSGFVLFLLHSICLQSVARPYDYAVGAIRIRAIKLKITQMQLSDCLLVFKQPDITTRVDLTHIEVLP